MSDALAPVRDGIRGPQRIVTLGTCIVDSSPDGWALPWTNNSDAELDQHRASLGLGTLEFATLRTWVSRAIDDGRFGWTNTFLSLDAAREFKFAAMRCRQYARAHGRAMQQVAEEPVTKSGAGAAS